MYQLTDALPYLPQPMYTMQLRRHVSSGRGAIGASSQMSRSSNVSLLRPSHFHSSRYGTYRTPDTVTYRIPTQAVEDLHKVGFIHRDLKPTNLSIGHKVYGSLRQSIPTVLFS